MSRFTLLTASVVAVLLSGSPAQAQVAASAIITSTKVPTPGRPGAVTFTLVGGLTTAAPPVGASSIDGSYQFFELPAGQPPVGLNRVSFDSVVDPAMRETWFYQTPHTTSPTFPVVGKTYRVDFNYRFATKKPDGTLVYGKYEKPLSTGALLVAP